MTDMWPGQQISGPGAAPPPPVAADAQWPGQLIQVGSDHMGYGDDPRAAREGVAGLAPTGTVEALQRGVGRGFMAGFNDEGNALSAASPLPGAQAVSQSRISTLPNPVDMLAGGARILGEKMGIVGGDTGSKAYEARLAEERDADKRSEQTAPIASTVGDVGGMLLNPISRVGAGAKTLWEASKLTGAGGAMYGALRGAGEGEGAADTATRAATGGALGGAVGMAAPPVVSGIGAIASYPVRKTLEMVRGLRDPEAEATRRVAGALGRDMAAGNATDQAVFDAAQQAGAPVTVMDAGGETTRALARSAKNTSPEAAASLENAVQGRAATSTERVADTIGGMGSGQNITEQRAALASARSGANRDRYTAAYEEGKDGVWMPEFHDLLQAPAAQQAIKDVNVTARNYAAAEGRPPPFTNAVEFRGQTVPVPEPQLPGGKVSAQDYRDWKAAHDAWDVGPKEMPDPLGAAPRLKMNPDGTHGATAQYWDYFLRNMDSQVTKAYKDGDPSAPAVQRIRDQMRDSIYTAVPKLEEARVGAAKAFRARDAFEAGQNFASGSAAIKNEEAQTALAKMSDAERTLFKDGYVAGLTNKVKDMRATGGSPEQLLNSISKDEQAVLALGPKDKDKLEATLRIEHIMNQNKMAVTGNSTTAQQLASIGMAGTAGGALGGYEGGWTPQSMSTGALAGTALRLGGRAVDQRVARHVGEILASSDPQKMAQLAQLAAQSPKYMGALRAITNSTLGGGAGDVGARAGGAVQRMIPPFPAGTYPVAADQQGR